MVKNKTHKYKIKTKMFRKKPMLNNRLLLRTIHVTMLMFLYFSLVSFNNTIFAQNANSQSPSFSTSSYLSLVSTLTPPSISNQLSPQQLASSTNKTCTLTPSLVERDGTPQQTEGPYFVNGMPNRFDI